MTALLLFAIAAAGFQAPQTPSPSVSAPTLLQVKRIYVAELTGGTQADALRELIIASLNGTKLFVLTENPDRADAVLKGAADDHPFTDTFDSSDSMNVSQRAGYGGGTSAYGGRSSGSYGAVSLGENESHHIKERKHEAYATVRLVDRDGDVLWSTTQESDGAKFRGASADVAAKIARQLLLDVEKARRSTTTQSPASTPAQTR